MRIAGKQAISYQDKIIAELDSTPDIHNQMWNSFDEDVMRKYYGKKPARAIAKTLGTTIDAVYGKARRMGIGAK